MLKKDQKFPIPARSIVKIRTWASMKRSYGTNLAGDLIPTLSGVTDEMKFLCGTIVTLTAPIKGNSFAVESGVACGYFIDAFMIDSIVRWGRGRKK